MAQEIVSILELFTTSANLLLALGLLVFIIAIARIFTTGVLSTFFKVLRVAFVFLLLANIFSRLSAARVLPGPPSPYSLLALDDIFNTAFIVLQFVSLVILYRQWRKIQLAEVSRAPQV